MGKVGSPFRGERDRTAGVPTELYHREHRERRGGYRQDLKDGNGEGADYEWSEWHEWREALAGENGLDLSGPSVLNRVHDGGVKALMGGLERHEKDDARRCERLQERTGGRMAQFFRFSPDKMGPFFPGEVLVDHKRLAGGPKGFHFAPKQVFGRVFPSVGPRFDLQAVVGVQKDQFPALRLFQQRLEPCRTVFGGVRDDRGAIFCPGEKRRAFQQAYPARRALRQHFFQAVE